MLVAACGTSASPAERLSEPANQERHHRRRGSRGGRPPAFDRVDRRNRNVVERGFWHVKQWRKLTTRNDKLAFAFRGGAVLKATSPGSTLGETRPR
ncbi:transposase [Streptomyces aurantiacus]|nr:transposase [Streptomyces aurantiacus]